MTASQREVSSPRAAVCEQHGAAACASASCSPWPRAGWISGLPAARLCAAAQQELLPAELGCKDRAMPARWGSLCPRLCWEPLLPVGPAWEGGWGHRHWKHSAPWGIPLLSPHSPSCLSSLPHGSGTPVPSPEPRTRHPKRGWKQGEPGWKENTTTMSILHRKGKPC